jgi:3-oxoacyl-[acyl-carrier-protein] synthase-3
MNACIVATGRSVPNRRLTNQDLEARLGEPVDAWLIENVGIRNRHIMEEGQTTSDLATAAGLQALARAGWQGADLDLVIVATDTPDHPSPATAAVVQYRLGATSAAAYDVNCACASFVTALDIAAKTLASDRAYRRALVVGAYGMSKYIDWTDKRTCTLFADGAGAVLLEARNETGFLGARLEADGSFHDALGIFDGHVKFVRRFPATFNTERWPALIKKVLSPHAMSPRDVSLYIFTQLNLRTIEATMSALDVPLDRTHTTMQDWGYTGSACIGMTLDDAVEKNRLQPGDHVILCATGGGLALGCALFCWV